MSPSPSARSVQTIHRPTGFTVLNSRGPFAAEQLDDGGAEAGGFELRGLQHDPGRVAWHPLMLASALNSVSPSGTELGGASVRSVDLDHAALGAAQLRARGRHAIQSR